MRFKFSMLSKGATTLVLAVVACACGDQAATDAKDTVTMTGVVHRSDRKVATVSFVTFRPGAEQIPVVTQSENGRFSAEVPAGVLLTLAVAAPGHKEAHIPVYLHENQGDARVDVTLAANSYRENISEVLIYGNWGGIETTFEDSLVLQDDGRWTLELGASGEKLKYQLWGITTDQRTVNGQGSGTFEYDGCGDFFSVVEPIDGHVSIQFDPSKLLTTINTGVPSAVWDGDPDLTRISTIGLAVNAFDESLATAAQKHLEDHGDFEEFTFGGPQVFPMLLKAMNPENSSDVKAFAAVNLLKHLSENSSENPSVAEILDALPPSSPFWSLEALHSFFILSTLSDTDPIPLLQTFADDNPHVEIRANAVASQAFVSKMAGDQENFHLYLTRLRNMDAGELNTGKMANSLEPQGPLAPGNPVPDFSVNLLDGTHFTNADLLGHVTLIDFWATWCMPCVGEMSHLHDAWTRYHQQGLEILSFSLDNAPEDIGSFRQKKWPMPWEHVFLESGFSNSTARAFEVTGIPTLFLIGPEGKILESGPTLRNDTLLKTLEPRFQPGGRSQE